MPVWKQMKATRNLTAPKREKTLRPPGGSRQGVPNAIPASVKQMVEAALSEAGGVDYLTAMALQEPKSFLALVGKLIPQRLVGEITVLDPDNLLSRLAEGRERAKAQSLLIDHDTHEIIEEDDYDVEEATAAA